MSNARNLARVLADSSGAIATTNLGNAIPADGSITAIKIADGAITSTKLAAGAAISSGTVAYFGMSTAPAGWLKANGAAISRFAYADLFAAIGTTYGAGDGSTTFVVPDLRGEFPRGWDDGRGADSGRGIGTTQSHAFGSHNHGFGMDGTVGSTKVNPGSTWGFAGSGAGQGHTVSTVGDTETRPRNVALLACIKY